MARRFISRILDNPQNRVILVIRVRRSSQLSKTHRFTIYRRLQMWRTLTKMRHIQDIIPHDAKFILVDRVPVLGDISYFNVKFLDSHVQPISRHAFSMSLNDPRLQGINYYLCGEWQLKHKHRFQRLYERR